MRPSVPVRARQTPNARPSLAPRNHSRSLTTASPEVNVRQGKAKEARGDKQVDAKSERSPAHTREHHRGPQSLSVIGAPFGFDDIDTVMQNMDRLANRMLRGSMFGPDMFREFRDFAPAISDATGENAAPRTAARWRPAVDIQEDKEKYTVHAELPGMKKEDVKVEVDEGVLTLRGERKLETKEEDKERRYTRVERQYGSFMRRFPLPKDVDATAIKAAFRDGVLEVRLPRSAEKAKASEIAIE